MITPESAKAVFQDRKTLLYMVFTFIPSFAVQPPAVTATHLYAPDFTRAAASISA